MIASCAAHMVILLTLGLTSTSTKQPAALELQQQEGHGTVDGCGNGHIGARRYDQVCASCVPGGLCPCGWAPQMEECDGPDVGGQSCASLGFLRGTLRCTATCTLDKSDCQTTAAKTGTDQETRLIDALQGRDFALAQNGAVLGAAASESGVVRFGVFNATTLAAGGMTKWAPPANFPPGAIGMERVNNAWYDPLWSPAVAALGDGFVLAVEHAAYHGYAILTFRTARDGALGEPVARVAGRHPLFLVPGPAGSNEALLGFETAHGVEVVRVDRDGKLHGEPVALPASNHTLGNAAAAVLDGNTWVVVTGPRESNDHDLRLRMARVDPQGAVRAAVDLAARSASFTLAPTDGGVWLAYSTDGEVLTMDLPSGATPQSPRHLADRLPILLAAESHQGQRVVWASDRRGITRIKLGKTGQDVGVEAVLAVPGTEIGAVLARAGGLYAFLKNQAGKASLHLVP